MKMAVDTLGGRMEKGGQYSGMDPNTPRRTVLKGHQVTLNTVE